MKRALGMLPALLIAVTASAAVDEVKAGDVCQLSQALKLKTTGGATIRLEADTQVEVLEVSRRKIKVKVSDVGAEGTMKPKALLKSCDLYEPPPPQPVPASAPPPKPPVAEPKPEPAPTPPAPPPKADPPPVAKPAPAPKAQPMPGKVVAQNTTTEASTEEIMATEVSDETRADQPTEGVGVPVGTIMGEGQKLVWEGSAVIRIAMASHNPAVQVGVRGTARIADHFLAGLGLFGTALGSRVNTDINNRGFSFRNERFLRMDYATLDVGYTTSVERLIQVQGRLSVGAGAIAHHSYDGRDEYIGPDFFMLFSPSGVFVVNLTQAARLSLGVGYRWDFGVDLEGFDPLAATEVNLLDGFNFDFGVQVDL